MLIEDGGLYITSNLSDRKEDRSRPNNVVDISQDLNRNNKRFSDDEILKRINFYMVRRLETGMLEVCLTDRLRAKILERLKAQGLEAPELEGLEVRITARLKAIKQ